MRKSKIVDEFSTEKRCITPDQERIILDFLKNGDKTFSEIRYGIFATKSEFALHFLNILVKEGKISSEKRITLGKEVEYWRKLPP